MNGQEICVIVLTWSKISSCLTKKLCYSIADATSKICSFGIFEKNNFYTSELSLTLEIYIVILIFCIDLALMHLRSGAVCIM
eukprot:c44624_g1_i1 orf=124-369(-)